MSVKFECFIVNVMLLKLLQVVYIHNDTGSVYSMFGTKSACHIRLFLLQNFEIRCTTIVHTKKHNINTTLETFWGCYKKSLWEIIWDFNNHVLALVVLNIKLQKCINVYNTGIWYFMLNKLPLQIPQNILLKANLFA